MTVEDGCQVARLHAPGDIRVDREPRPEASRGDVLIGVTAVGLCGSDRHWFREGSIGDATLTRPLVLGHEFAGVVLEGRRAGQRVVGDPAVPCGRCDQCRAGATNVCPATRFAGFGRDDGALRSVMAWPAPQLHPVPDAIDDDAAALLEPLGVALHALDLSPVTAGQRAGVFGCGPLGLLLVTLLRLAGASVIIATDRLPHRVAAARDAGATHAYLTPDEDPAVGADRDGPVDHEPLDVAFEAAGDDGAVADAIAAVRPHGRVELVGIPDGDRTSFPAALARRKEISLQLCRRMAPTDLARATDLAASGRVELAPLITHRFPLDAVAAAFDTLSARRGLKVIVNPGGGPA